MGIKQVILIVLVAVMPVIVAWKSIVSVDAGREHTLTLGMEDSASVGFDISIDKPSPPPPPIGFYCFFSLSDTNYDFIDGLWGDIRPLADSARWEVILRRQEELATISVDSLPSEGYIYINDQKINSSEMQLVVPPNTPTINIEYKKHREVLPLDSQ
ncbi:hypothetical protein KAH81_03100 [bacterium]|nr:hypothetical protein [bacterium]